jgi:hypothetical protein
MNSTRHPQISSSTSHAPTQIQQHTYNWVSLHVKCLCMFCSATVLIFFYMQLAKHRCKPSNPLLMHTWCSTSTLCSNALSPRFQHQPCQNTDEMASDRTRNTTMQSRKPAHLVQHFQVVLKCAVSKVPAPAMPQHRWKHKLQSNAGNTPLLAPPPSSYRSKQIEKHVTKSNASPY